MAKEYVAHDTSKGYQSASCALIHWPFMYSTNQTTPTQTQEVTGSSR